MKRNKVNRILLSLAGAVLLVVGLLVLFGGLDLARRWNLDMPSWWPWDDPDQPLLSDADRTQWKDEGWWWPAAFAALGLLLVIGVWWLLAQFGRRRLSQVLVPVPEEEYHDGGLGAARLRARAMEHAIAVETEQLDGVEAARVTLHGRRRSPVARVRLTLAAHADPDFLAGQLERGPLYRAKSSAGLAELPVVLRMRSDRHTARRVE